MGQEGPQMDFKPTTVLVTVDFEACWEGSLTGIVQTVSIDAPGWLRSRARTDRTSLLPGVT